MALADITTTKRSFAYSRNATFLGLLVGYAGYYLCRQNFAVAYPAMKDLVHMDKAMFGQITSFGTLMYAFGKFTTGALADTRGGRFVFFLGLVGVVVTSLVFSLGSTLSYFFVMWGLVRLFQSMGWGGLVNIMSRWFSARQYGLAMGVMSINYQFGGVLATVFAGYLLAMGLRWEALFAIPALVLAAIGLICWFLIVGSPHDVGHAMPRSVEVTGQSLSSMGLVTDDEKLSYASRFKIVLSDRAFLVMCAISFILTLLRECFNTWMPTYFAEMGAPAATAAFKSSVFPLLGCVGTLFAGWFSDKYLQGRRGPMMAALMVVLVALLLGLGQLEFLAHTFGLEKTNLAMGLVAAAGFFLLGPYSLVGGVVALDFGGRKTAGTAAGLLDSVGYLGATLSGWGVAEIVLKWGWARAYTAMAVLTLFAIALCGLLWRVGPRE